MVNGLVHMYRIAFPVKLGIQNTLHTFFFHPITNKFMQHFFLSTLSNTHKDVLAATWAAVFIQGYFNIQTGLMGIDLPIGRLPARPPEPQPTHCFWIFGSFGARKV